jgi:putative FmdB family regulatory protein
MPIYEYTCLDCGERFEALRSMKDADATIPCKKCEGNRTTRQVSACYAQSGGRIVAGSASAAGGCAGCAGGSCAGCGH